MIYRGHRDGSGIALIEVLREGDPIGTPLRHHVRHSPTGFEWGYAGSGPADTARSLLADHLGFVPHPLVYQRFKARVVQVMPATWELDSATIAHHLDAIRIECGIACVRCADWGFIEDPAGECCSCAEGCAFAAEIGVE